MESFLALFRLSKQEMIVYKALLQKGMAGVSLLSRVTGIKRTSCQEYIRALQEKGFINATKQGNKYFYHPEDPDKLRQVIQERLYIVDRLLPILHETGAEEEWKVRSLTDAEAQKILRRAKRKKQHRRQSVLDNAQCHLIGDQITLLRSQQGDLSAIEIFSKDLTNWHRKLMT